MSNQALFILLHNRNSWKETVVQREIGGDLLNVSPGWLGGKYLDAPRIQDVI
jgi:hypothetical protein